MTTHRVAVLLLLSTCLPAAAQTRSGYPVAPRPLPEAEEIELAVSAAPPEVSANADVYVLRGTEFVKVRSGTNGCACMVARDLHEEGRYPICFDREAAQTVMLREMKETSLRAKGKSEAEVKQEIDALLKDRALPTAKRPAVAYMMSPRQVLFSSPEANGVRVGAWHPHVMMTGVGLTHAQLGFPQDTRYLYIQPGSAEAAGSLHEFVVLVPVWSDGAPGPEPRK